MLACSKSWLPAVALKLILLAMLLAGNAWAQDKPKVEIVPIVPHSGVVHAVVFSPDGSRVLSGSWDKTLKLWELETGRLIRTLEGHSNVVTSVAFSPDGVHLLSGSWDKTIRLWDMASGRLVRTFEGHTASIFSVAFSRDGARVLSGSSDKTIKLWDTATGALIRSFEGHTAPVSSVVFSPNGTGLLSGGDDQTIKLWDAATGALVRTFEGHAAVVRSVAFSPDGSRVLSGSGDKTIKLWDTATGALIRTFEGDHGLVYSVAFSPDGASVASGSEDKIVKLWNAATGRLVQTLKGHSFGVTSVVFSPDGRRVLSASYDPMRLWDVETGQLVRVFDGGAALVSSAAFSPDGARVLSGSWDKTLKLWDMATGQLIRTFAGHSNAATSVAFLSDGSRALSGGWDGTLKLWDVATGNLIRSFEGRCDHVNAIALSPKGSRALSACVNRTIELWDVATGALIRTFEGHSDQVVSVAFSPDGARLLSGGFDNTVIVWDTATGRPIHSLQGHSDRVLSVAFSPDGTQLLSGSSDGTLRLWDAATGQLVRTFHDPEQVYWANFSPDGVHVLSASHTKLRLWETATGQAVRTFEGHTGLVVSAAFSSDGRRIVSSSADTTTRVWTTATAELLVTLYGTRENEWLVITPAGFFAASSSKGAEVLSVVRELEVNAIAHFYSHLYRPDLVEQLLKGDPEGKYADAASKLNLQTILESGAAPQIETIPERKTEHSGDTIKMTLRLVDTGGGIGDKMVWRVNGVTQGDVSAMSGGTHGSYRLMTQTLKINPSVKNLIEVIAYNRAGLLATEPWRVEIDKFGESTERRPRMHVLAVGVSEYARQDWRLKYAASDASAFAELLKTAARELYDDVKVTLVLDGEATASGVGAAIDRLKTDVHPSDVFVLFVAGHGRNIAGTYYFIPQDLSFEGGRTVMSHGIGQDQLQGWLAKIPAQKSILILDTCESATATRSLDVERETAIDRLRYATGRSVITAAGNAAFEGYEGHGLLTHAILKAFRKADSGGDAEEVDLYQVATHIDREVPALSQRVFGILQRPHSRIEGNFPLGTRIAGLKTLETVSVPSAPTHVLIRQERVRERPREDAGGERILSAGTQVRVVEFADTWVIVARDGQKLGYLPEAAVARLQ